MTDFHNYSEATKMEATAEYTFYEIQGEPMIVVAPTTEQNPAYMNYILKNSRAHMRQIEAGNLSVDLLKQLRSRDRELFPRFVVKNFSDNIVDSNGERVPFSQDAAKDFIDALPDHVFDGLRDFAGKIANFVEYDTADVGDLAKN